MLVPQFQHNMYYYVAFPFIWSLFISIYYIIPAFLSTYCKDIVISQKNAKKMWQSGLIAYFFATPFVQAYTNCFFFLFFISTQTLLIYAIASFVFQCLYLRNANITKSNNQLVLLLSMTNMLGYWLTCLLYYILPYTSKMLAPILMRSYPM